MLQKFDTFNTSDKTLFLCLVCQIFGIWHICCGCSKGLEIKFIHNKDLANVFVKVLPTAQFLVLHSKLMYIATIHNYTHLFGGGEGDNRSASNAILDFRSDLSSCQLMSSPQSMSNKIVLAIKLLRDDYAIKFVFN